MGLKEIKKKESKRKQREKKTINEKDVKDKYIKTMDTYWYYFRTIVLFIFTVMSTL